MPVNPPAIAEALDDMLDRARKLIDAERRKLPLHLFVDDLRAKVEAYEDAVWHEEQVREYEEDLMAGMQLKRDIL